MLRPGCFDALIHVTKPDADAAVRLVRLYAGNLLDENEPLTSLGFHLEGFIPAIISEVVNRSKLGMIGRGEKRIIEADLIVAAESMKMHSELLNPDEKKPNKFEALGRAFADVVSGPEASYDGDLATDLSNIESEAGGARSNAQAAYQLCDEELPKIRRLLENANANAQRK